MIEYVHIIIYTIHILTNMILVRLVRKTPYSIYIYSFFLMYLKKKSLDLAEYKIK